MVDYHIIVLNMAFLPKMSPKSRICLILNQILSCASKSQTNDRIRLINLYFTVIVLARVISDPEHIIRVFEVIHALT